MTRRLSFLVFLVAACGGGGGGSAAPQESLSLRVQLLDKAVGYRPVPVHISVRRGNALAQDYTGEVTFHTEDPNAWYPPNYRLTPADRGEHTFPAQFMFPGGVHLLDTQAEGIEGEFRFAVSVEGAPGAPVPTFVPGSLPPPPGPVKYFTRLDSIDAPGNDFALGDVDGDGDLDMVVAGTGDSGVVDLWLNDGAAKFVKSAKVADLPTVRVTLADVDGDGDPDLGLSCMFNNVLYQGRILLNNGSGGFTDSGQDLGTVYAMVFGDVDGDGDADLVAISGSGFVVRANDGNGKFTSVLQSDGSGGGNRPLLCDLDGDSDLDLVAHWGIWLNGGAGTFSKGQALLTYGTVVPGDMDGDGDLDLAVGKYNLANDLYLNDGHGAFTLSDAWQTGTQCTTDLAVLDLDEDGDLDIIEGNVTNAGVVWLYDGSTFASDSDLTAIVLAGNTRFGVGDLDGDGDPDFVGQHVGWGAAVYRND